MKVRSFAFFGDILEPMGSEIHLFDHYVLVKANEEEQVYIKQQTDRFQQVAGPSSFEPNRYESVMKPNESNGFTHEPLAREDWAYYVVKHNLTQLDRVFSLVVGLSKLDLTVIVEGVYSNFTTTGGKQFPGMLHSPLTAVNYFLDNHIIDCVPKSFDNSVIAEMESVYCRLQEFERIKDQFSSISKALDDFLKLQEISARSPFKILNYFSIFELLLTTYRPGQSHESSLNSQLQNKLTLINNRLINPIDVTKYFKGPDTLTLGIILGKLYQYRNNIAHGNESDFDSELQIIGSNRTIKIQFLRDLLKQILILSINEPVFVRDLKTC